jgi:hypothetical protein
MSEVPELRAAVRLSAERLLAPRRPARRIAPLLAVAAAVVVAVMLLPRTADDEVPAVTPTPTPTATASTTPATTQAAQAAVGNVFGAFRRPQRAADRTPALREEHIANAITFRTAGVRRLAVSGDFAVYGIPGLENGQIALCVLITRASKPAGEGCGPFPMSRPHWSKLFLRPAPLYSLLVPDGTETVQVHLKSGQVLTKRVQDNAVLFRVKGLKRMTWRDAAGVMHSTRAAV